MRPFNYIVLSAMTTLVFFGITAAKADVTITLAAATVTATSVPNAVTATFDTTPVGYHTSLATNVGTLTDTSGTKGFYISSANQYGGAGGTGNYLAVGSGEAADNTATLTFNAPQAYFGLYYSAADSGNVLSLYDGTTLVQTLNAQQFINVIKEQSPSTEAQYYGNPNAPYKGQDSGEPFAFINFYATGSTVFTSAVFSQLASSGGGFESDNPTIAGSYTTVTGTPLVPEPSSTVAITIGAIGLAGLLFLKKRSLFNSGC